MKTAPIFLLALGGVALAARCPAQKESNLPAAA